MYIYGMYTYGMYTGTPPLTRFFGPWENCVKGKPHYRRSILVLKPKNGEYTYKYKVHFFASFSSVKLQLQSLHLYLFLKSKEGANGGI